MVCVDVGGTLWPDSFPSSVGDHQERVARLRDGAGGLSELRAAEVIESLSGFAHFPSGRQQTAEFVVETVARFGLEGVVMPESIDRRYVSSRRRAHRTGSWVLRGFWNWWRSGLGSWSCPT